jgi:uncharacterized protein (TIGR02996 family)
VSDREVHRGLLQAIVAAPEDRGPREVYADWLEERGDPRARFFRRPDGLDWHETTTLWNECALKLTKRFPLHSYQSDPLGVLRVVAIPVNLFLKRYDEILDLFPLADTVTFVLETRLEVAKLAASPRLAQIAGAGFRAVQKGKRLGNVGLRTFLGSPHISGLKELHFTTSDVSGPGLAALAKVDLPALRTLSFDNNPVGAKGIAGLSKAKGLRLTTLSFSFSCKMDDEAAALLAEWPGLATVRTLVIRYDNKVLGEKGLVALAESPYTRKLEELEIPGACFGDRAARAVLALPALKRFVCGNNAQFVKIKNAALKEKLNARFGVTLNY